MTPDKKAIGARLREIREAPPYWSRSELARLLRAAADPRDRPGLPHVGPLTEMIKHWETGKRTPSRRYRALYARVTGLTQAELFGVPISQAPALPAADSASPNDYAALVRDTNRHLIVLDSRFGGTSVAALAVQAFTSAKTALATGRHDADERDLLAAAGETGEIAAWTLYDANRLAESRATAHEAMLLSRLAGDRSMELFELSHLALIDVKQRHGREALRIAEHAIEDVTLAPRVKALFNIRAARSLAQAGDRARSLDRLERVASVLQDSMHSRDPAWSWWLDASELAVQRGLVYAELGDHKAAMPYFDEAAHGRLRQDPYSPRSQAGPVTAHGQQWGRAAYNDLVHLFVALTKASAWMDAEAVATTVTDFTREVVSAQTEVTLHVAVRTVLRPRGGSDRPSSTLADLAKEIAEARGWSIGGAGVDPWAG
ncbi:helix-turn-helix transcriptional regulator [Actinomadura graeca]|uniref:Helix-turn-helix transcriptional regulator n=1 Tax=Actinomadura graeca TaxID=2750812 RepID=A0ABX8QVG1_9ACTN|nr:helix-turn-helix transcriptional regulator [Actinomadura graeca]QXJ22760.1 helix-turn-helix transcriptional regulator [Actinomadura graeca]